MVPGMSRFEPVVYVLVRTPNMETNPASLATRANTFAAATKDCSAATMLVHRGPDGMNGFLVLVGPDDSVARAALSIAQAVGARAERGELPASLAEPTAVARAVYRRGSSVARETIMGTDPTEISRRLEVALRQGDWVALTLREASRMDDRRNEDWTDYRLGSSGLSHQSRQPDAQVVSIFAGSADFRSADRLIDMTRSALHGFDLKVTSHRVSLLRGVAPFAAVALAAGAAGGALALDQVAPVAGLPVASAAATVLFGVAALAFGGFLARVTGVWPTLWHRVRRGLPAGVLPAPPHRLLPPARPRKEERDANGKRVSGRPGGYPLHRSSFLMAPVIFVGVIAPHSSAAAVSATSRQRQVPPRMQQPIGPLVGFDGTTPAYLSVADSYSGIALMGRAGSGKSQLVRSLFGWSCLDRNHPTGIPGSTGSRNTLVAFESKGAGVTEYQAWAAATSTPLLFIDLADPASYAIDLFATKGSIAQRAEAFVNGLVYAFEDGSIKDRAFTSMLGIYTAALAISEEPEMVSGVAGVDPTGSVNYFANIIVGGLGDTLAIAVATEVLGRAKRADTLSPSVRAAAEALAPFFEGSTAAARRSLFESSQNKIKQLTSVESWWSPSRRKVSWSQVLAHPNDNHRAVLINTGSSLSSVPVEDKISGIMASLLMYSLQRAIRHECQDWEDEHRSISIFADELALLSGSSPDVITWLKDQGRSYGVRPVFATQRPAQLKREVREVFLNFGTFICFNQEDRATAIEAATQLSGYNGEVSDEEVMFLSKYNAVVRGYADGSRQSPFTVQVFNFEADRAQAAAHFGIEGSAPVPSPVMPDPRRAPHQPVPAAPQPVAQPVAQPVDPDAPVMPDRLPSTPLPRGPVAPEPSSTEGLITW